MENLTRTLVIILVFQLTGCAAMFHGSNDQITVTSGDPDAKLYVDANYLGKGSGTTVVKRNTVHTVFAKKKGCADGVVQTQTTFDSVSLLGILIDLGLISMLVVDWAATGAMWKTDPLLYSVTPNCEDANLGRPKESFPPVKSEKLRAGVNQDVGGPLSDVDTTLPKFAAIPRPHDVALVIGIEKYQKLIPARHARADAEQVANYLRKLGYAPRNVEVLLDERATQTTVRLALEQWLPNHVQADSRVLIYYSGHGSVNPETGDTYLVPHDGDPAYLINTAYPTKMLYSNLADLKVKQVVVALDSCFSGQGGRSVMMEGARPAVAKIEDPALASRHLAVLAASASTQISTSSKTKQHGLFTYYFLKALQEGKQDLASIYDYMSPKVQDEAKLQNVQQSPSLRPGPEQIRGQFALWDKQ